jgi:hypothetical protein
MAKWAVRSLLALLFLLVVISIGLRTYSYFVTREIYAVISGFERVRIDSTTEAQLIEMVPQLVLENTGQNAPDARKYYRAEISNRAAFYRSMWWVPSSLLMPNDLSEDKWTFTPPALKIAYLMGWRNVVFGGSAIVVNGIVRQIGFGMEPDVITGFPRPSFFNAGTDHAFWAEHARKQVPVDDSADEQPQLRFGRVAGEFSWFTGTDDFIAVVYTPEAPRDLVAHAFRVDLTCFWGLRGCDSIRQVVPLVWEDRNTIAAAAAARLASTDPCPDRILTGRVRYLLDMAVALLEVVKSPTGLEYRLKEVIRNPAGLTIEIPPVSSGATPKPGNQVLYFTGAKFSSCQIVPATPSAVATVRNTLPAPKFPEDDDYSRLSGRL